MAIRRNFFGKTIRQSAKFSLLLLGIPRVPGGNPALHSNTFVAFVLIHEYESTLYSFKNPHPSLRICPISFSTKLSPVRTEGRSKDGSAAKIFSKGGRRVRGGSNPQTQHVIPIESSNWQVVLGGQEGLFGSHGIPDGHWGGGGMQHPSKQEPGKPPGQSPSMEQWGAESKQVPAGQTLFSIRITVQAPPQQLTVCPVNWSSVLPPVHCSRKSPHSVVRVQGGNSNWISP